MAVNLYPDQLDEVSAILRGLDAIPDAKTDTAVSLSARIPLSIEGLCIGWAVDEVGGAWSFLPREQGEPS